MRLRWHHLVSTFTAKELVSHHAAITSSTRPPPCAAVGLHPAFAAPRAPAVSANPSATELTFLISGDPTDETAYQQLIDAFVARHPAISVDLVNIPSGGDFRKRLAADFAAGTPPDLFLINYRNLGRFLASGAVEPLTTYLAASTLIKTSDYYPQALAAFQWQGEQACMPQNMSSPVIYYNKDLFDAAGVAYPAGDWDWADFVAVAQALTQDGDHDGVTDIYGFGTEATIVRMAPFVWMNGGDIVDDSAAHYPGWRWIRRRAKRRWRGLSRCRTSTTLRPMLLPKRPKAA